MKRAGFAGGPRTEGDTDPVSSNLGFGPALRTRPRGLFSSPIFEGGFEIPGGVDV
jgi:hypothetical protein